MSETEPDLEHRIRQLENRSYIHEMTARFADAANRVDPEAFLALWSEDAAWTIGPPITKRFTGHAEIREAFLGLLCNAWEFLSRCHPPM